MLHAARRGITLIESLVSSIAAVLLFVTVVAAVAQGRNDSRLTKSFSNLRNLAVAAQAYAADWEDRQCTLVRDDLARFGESVQVAVAAYNEKGEPHPPIILGWQQNGELAMLAMDDPANHHWLEPISFDTRPIGWHRLTNNKHFSQYLSGRFYDPVFYAPKDHVALEAAERFFEIGAEYAPAPDGDLYYSSYCWSPAALYHPDVLGRPSKGGFKDPFSFAAGLRAPSLSQCRYPDLKTHMIEHHWLQNRPAWVTDVNEAVEDGAYAGREPYYFNHYAFSAPAAAFYDGSVRLILTNDVLDDDQRVREQTKSEHGLWYRNPGGAIDGYYESLAVDPTRTSFHIFTIEGILGRDLLSTDSRNHLEGPAPRRGGRD